MENKIKKESNKKVILILSIAIISIIIISIILFLLIFTIKKNIMKNYTLENETLVCSFSLYSDYTDSYNSSIIEYDNKNIINKIIDVENIEVFDDEVIDINKIFNEQKNIDKEFSKVDGLTLKTIMPDGNTLYSYQIRDLKKTTADSDTEEKICKENSEYCSNDFSYSYGITVDKYVSKLKKYLNKLYDINYSDIVCE